MRADSQGIHSYPQLFSQPLAALDLCALVLLIILQYEFALFRQQSLQAAIEALVFTLFLFAERGQIASHLWRLWPFQIFHVDQLGHPVEIEARAAFVVVNNGFQFRGDAVNGLVGEILSLRAAAASKNPN